MEPWVASPPFSSPSRSRSSRRFPAAAAPGAPVTCYGRAATIVGTEGPETLTGTGGSDVIAGLGGNDVVNGGSGKDFICAGAGADTVDGGPGLDNIEASDGNDALTGGAGADYVSYFDAPAAAKVNLANGTGTGWGADTLSGFEGVVGSRFADKLTGGGADDQLEGRNGPDVLVGGGGDDYLLPGLGNDQVKGGAGYDYVIYWDAARGITANLATRRATGEGTDRFTSIEGIGGSDHADVFTGNGGPNGLYGYIGNDRLLGKGGNDWIYAGPGKDFLDGGAGTDRLHGEQGKDTCVNGEQQAQLSVIS